MNFDGFEDVVFFDTETTSADPTTTKIVQLAYKWGEKEGNIIINPLEHISEGASKVHGFTDESVKSRQPFKHYAQELYALFDGKYWGGYNCAQFDVPILKREFSLIGMPVPKCKGILDGYKVFCAFYGQPRVRGARTLTAAHKFYCGSEFANAHDALADIRATASVMESQMVHHKGLTIEKIREISMKRDNKIDRRGVFKFDPSTKEVVITIGKHNGKTIDKIPVSYLAWMASGDAFDSTVKKICTDAMKGLFPVWQENN
jgi:DNA polymerase-3 subunit epsilon